MNPLSAELIWQIVNMAGKPIIRSILSQKRVRLLLLSAGGLTQHGRLMVEHEPLQFTFLPDFPAAVQPNPLSLGVAIVRDRRDN